MIDVLISRRLNQQNYQPKCLRQDSDLQNYRPFDKIVFSETAVSLQKIRI